jgi:archaellum component FlaG (FlaF/FlaG flagellin family)
MASSAISELILFMGAILVASTVAGGFIATSNSINDSLGSRLTLLRDQISTSIKIINDPTNIPIVEYMENYYYVFYIKNTGVSNIGFSKNNVLVFIDGYMIRNEDMLFRRATELKVGETTEILINAKHWILTPGEHKLSISLENNVQDNFYFVVHPSPSD